MSRHRYKKKRRIKALLFNQGGIGIYGLFILCLIFGLSNSADAFTAEFGDTCAGLSAGLSYTCILTAGGNVYCYGYNWDGQAQDYTEGDAIGVSAGYYHTCILTSDGNVDCYGQNWYGETEDYIGGNAVGVSAGGRHTCVLKTNGNVDCYGWNDYGQAEDYTGGDAVGVSAGGSYSGGYTCVLTSGGNVNCYGDSHYGQASDYTWGDAVGVSAGDKHACILTSGGNVHCYGFNDSGQSEDYTEGDAVGVSAGWGHTCVLTSDGNADCYGHGQDYTGGDAICTQTIPLPTSKQSFFYPAVSTRVMNMNPNMAKPVGVGSIANDGWYLGVNMGLFRFSGLIDIYGAYTVSTDPQTVNVLNTNGSSFRSFTMSEIKNALSTGVPPVGVRPWITNTEGPININLLGTIPVSTLPSGTYTVYLLVAPTDSLNSYYLWITSFVIPDTTFITWEKTLGKDIGGHKW
jgi:hypothetical protein